MERNLANVKKVGSNVLERYLERYDYERVNEWWERRSKLYTQGSGRSCTGGLVVEASTLWGCLAMNYE